MRVLVDTDVVLDLVLKRDPFYTEAFTLWQLGDRGLFDRFISGITPINVFYIARKAGGAALARQSIAEVLAVVSVASIDSAVLRTAHTLPMADYEDAVQAASAVAAGLDAIVTRNTSDYQGSPLPVFSPAALIAQLAPPSNP